MDAENSRSLAAHIKEWGRQLGLVVRIASPDLGDADQGLAAWLDAGYHGKMDYMARHGLTRAHPRQLIPGTRAVVVARLDYRPLATDPLAVLADGNLAYISRYALGRDYHKVFRQRLQALANRMMREIGALACRPFVDSAPVMEVELAARAGLGWRGKHTLLLSRDAGSWFFLGEIFTDLPLPADQPAMPHCGRCQSCITICPTGAIVAPYRLDARRCISYLTIEQRGSIPHDLRPLIGNRIYGCDDCQIVCPWNRFASTGRESTFAVRHGLDHQTLTEIFSWTTDQFNERLAGSPIRRIGYECWLRNIAVGLGNAQPSAAVTAALRSRFDDTSELVREHVRWALAQHQS